MNKRNDQKKSKLMRRLLRSQQGNVAVITAAMIIPLIGLVGGGVDYSRFFLVKARLQQACDAGSLAGRKAMVTQETFNNQSERTATDFFDSNFETGLFGSYDLERNFTETGGVVTGTASVKIDNTLLRIFEMEDFEVSTSCQSQLDAGSADIMFVLDTTGSMTTTDGGGGATRMAGLRAAVVDFSTEVEASSAPGSVIRYGFVPYSSNVNVGGLLQRDWLSDNVRVQGRVATPRVVTEAVDQGGWQRQCTGSGWRRTCRDVWVSNWQNVTRTIPEWRYQPVVYSNTGLRGNNGGFASPNAMSLTVQNGNYSGNLPTNRTVRWNGCIEEAQTQEITDFNNPPDLDDLPDMDIHHVPTAGDEDTQWKMQVRDLYYYRAIRIDGGGNLVGGWDINNVTSQNNFVRFSDLNSTGSAAACPTAARALATMTTANVQTYANSLNPVGGTYHDIGLVWGGRMLSRTGIQAANFTASAPRHMIFMTDGITSPNELIISAYGMEPLDRRRGAYTDATMTAQINGRIDMICDQIRNDGIQLWVVAFGSEVLGDTNTQNRLRACASPDSYFEAANNAALRTTFKTIASRVADLRLVD